MSCFHLLSSLLYIVWPGHDSHVGDIQIAIVGRVIVSAFCILNDRVTSLLNRKRPNSLCKFGSAVDMAGQRYQVGMREQHIHQGNGFADIR